MSLLSGKYHLKFVVRENQTGRMGSFETDIDVPDLKAQPLKMSSVVLASQTQRQKGREPEPRWFTDGSEIIPNITHVFSPRNICFSTTRFTIQPAGGRGSCPGADKPGIRLLTNVAFFQERPRPTRVRCRDYRVECARTEKPPSSSWTYHSHRSSPAFTHVSKLSMMPAATSCFQDLPCSIRKEGRV